MVSSIRYQNGTLYAGVTVSGGNDSAYYSSDGGMTWNDISEGLVSQIVDFIEYDGNLYATMWGKDTILVWQGGSSIGINNSNRNDLELKLYPNPAKEILSLDFTGWDQSEKQIRILDMEGRTVFTDIGYFNKNYQIPVKKLDRGFYLIKVSDRKNQFVKKFLKY